MRSSTIRGAGDTLRLDWRCREDGGTVTNTVMGNGKPGHADRIRDLEESCEKFDMWRTEQEEKEKEREEEKKERAKEQRGLRNTIIGAVIIFIITTLLNLGMTYWITAHEAAEKAISALAH